MQNLSIDQIFQKINIENENDRLTLGDKQKKFEKIFDIKYPDKFPIIIRLDGKSFSKKTKLWKLNKPFDDRFTTSMHETCEFLFKELQLVKFIWCGSDEISIILDNSKLDGLYSRRLSKILSISASIATVGFNKAAKMQGLNIDDYPAYFDSRLTILPNNEEVYRNILFRQNDCIRNSISQYADSFYSNKELHKKNSDKKLKMMLDKGFDWEMDVPPSLKYGFLISKVYHIYDNKTHNFIEIIEKLDENVNYEEKGQYIRTKFITTSNKITKDEIIKLMN